MNNKIYTLLFCLISSYNISAQSHNTEIGFRCDNDAFLGQHSDRYYTDGFIIYYNHSLKVKHGKLLLNKIVSVETGQKTFTSYATENVNPRSIDRPFAAYLYVGSSLSLLYKDESNIKVGMRLGVVGPAAKGEELQAFVHKLFGFYKVSGWRYQIQNDVELNLSGEYKKLIIRKRGVDVSINTNVNLGNGFTGCGAGTLFRFGKFNQLFNSVSTQSTAIKNAIVSPLHSNECFFYYQPNINMVVYDATIQGSLFAKNYNHSSQITLDPRLFNVTQQFGLAYTAKRKVINVAVVFSTKNVKQMLHSHQWGSVTMLYRFG